MKQPFNILFICFILIVLISLNGTVWAQVNPTPIVITLPAGSNTPTPETAVTETPTLLPTATGVTDPTEPNNTPDTATVVSLGQTLTGLALVESDVDYFQVYLKAGQIGQFSTTVYGGLDTRATAYWGDGVIAEADDRSGGDTGTTLTFTAVLEGWYRVKIERATPYSGTYDLAVSAIDPTHTPTLFPTHTPFPTTTPLPTGTPLPTLTPAVPPDTAEPNNSPEMARGITPGSKGSFSVGLGDVDYFTFIAKAGNRYSCETITNQVDTLLTLTAVSVVIASNDDRSPTRLDSFVQWQVTSEQVIVIQVASRGGSTGAYELLCQIAAPPPMPPIVNVSPMATAVLSHTTSLTDTAVLTPSPGIPLTLRPLGQLPPAEPALTPIRLVVYYDLNNDRAPSPGEGIPNVSVLAVSAGGQRVAQLFTNLEGEAVFTASANIARLVVPFVSAWSVKIARTGAAETVNLTLGLPAVRIPVFLPLRGAGG